MDLIWEIVVLIYVNLLGYFYSTQEILLAFGPQFTVDRGKNVTHFLFFHLSSRPHYVCN